MGGRFVFGDGEGNSESAGADWYHTVDTVPDDTEDAEDDDFQKDI